MEPLFLKSVQGLAEASPLQETLAAMREGGVPIPQILYLFGFKPQMTGHLSRFTQELMRGPSPLSPGQRELIAAFTSARNRCVF